MHHPTDRIIHTTAFVTPVVEHWLEREIAQRVHPMKGRSDDPSHHERTLLPQSPTKRIKQPLRKDKKHKETSSSKTCSAMCPGLMLFVQNCCESSMQISVSFSVVDTHTHTHTLSLTDTQTHRHKQLYQTPQNKQTTSNYEETNPFTTTSQKTQTKNKQKTPKQQTKTNTPTAFICKRSPTEKR